MSRRRQLLTAWPIASLSIFLLVLPFDTWKFGPGAILSLSNLAFVLVLIGLALAIRGAPDRRTSDRWAFVLAAIFVVGFVPGATAAGDRGLAIRTLISEAGMAAAFVTVALLIRDRRSLTTALVAWCVGGLIAAAGAIGQFSLWLAGIQTGTAGIAGLCSTSFVMLKTEGFTDSSNYLGFFVLPIAVAGAVLSAHRSSQRWIVAAAAVACGLTVLLSYSRGAILALAVAASAGAVALVFARTQRFIPRAAGIAASVILLAMFARTLVGFNEASLVARLNIVNGAFHAIGGNPVSGIGLGAGVPLSTDIAGFCDSVVVISAKETVIPEVAAVATAAIRSAVDPTLAIATSSAAAPSAPPTHASAPQPVGAASLETPVPPSAPASAQPPVSAAPVVVSAPMSAPPPVSAAPVVVSVPVFSAKAESTVVASAAPTTVTLVSAMSTGTLSSDPSGPAFVSRDTHMTALQATTNGGLLGLGGFAVLVLGTMLFAARSWKTRTPMRTALFAAAIVAQVDGFAVDALAIKQLYVGLALLWAVSALEVGRTSDPV